MHTRFLSIFFGVVFALTLFFAVAAGAQEERTATEGVGVQVVEVHQQQVPNDQQQAVAVQQQVGAQESENAVGTEAIDKASGCSRPDEVVELRDEDTDEQRSFETTGDRFRWSYEVKFDDPDNDSNDFDVEITRDSGGFIDSDSTSDNGDDSFIVREDPDEFEIKTKVRPEEGATYTLMVEDCTGNETDNNDGGGGGGGGGGDGGGGGNNPVNIAQEGTSPDTTTSDLNTASPAAETTTADSAANADFANRPDSGSFRCDLFLRTVRDENGALRAQYRDGRGDDEFIVQRFEQCLSEDVLADTIPNRNLPFTGGMSLLFLGAIGLAAIVAGAAVLWAVMRRTG